MDTKTEQHFRGACRFKDKTKATLQIDNVDTWLEARDAMLEQPHCVAALVLVPHSESVLVPEYA